MWGPKKRYKLAYKPYEYHSYLHITNHREIGLVGLK